MFGKISEQAIKSKTKSGLKITLSYDANFKVIAEFIFPINNERVKRNIKWIKETNGEGLRCNINGENILLTIPELDYLKMKKIAVDAKDKDFVRRVEEQKPFVKLALVNSGSYLMNYEICYVLPLTNEEKKMKKALNAQSVNIEEIKYSDLIKNIMKKESDCILSYGESQIWFLNEDEKKDILDELELFTGNKKKKADDVKKAHEVRMESFLLQAKTTGKPVVINRYVTDECTQKNPIDCSFDQAIVYMLPSGKMITKYTCCH